MSYPRFSAVSSAASEVPERRHSAMKAASAGLASAHSSANGWSGETAQKLAPNRVSGRVVKTSSRSARPAMRKRITAPSDRPIQFACMARTDSGQRSRPASESSRSSAKSEMRNIHCGRLRRSTSAPDRQPLPSITCSLASTVRSTGSQFTCASAR